MVDKLYEVNGVIEYAQVFSEEVMAKSPKDAQQKVRKNLDTHIDKSISAEHSGDTVDLGVEVEGQ